LPRDRCPLPNILGAIGPTPIVKLNRLGEGLAANLYVKCDFLLPSGSSKDRVALHLVDRAEARGELKPGGTIIEATERQHGRGARDDRRGARLSSASSSCPTR
jgi:cysteine synthase